MATTAQVATLAWTCDQTETFDVSESIALPGWTSGYLAGGRWLMQARYPLNNPQATLNFDSAAGDGSLTQLSIASGAGLDSLGNPIAGATVALEFQQAEDVVRRAAPGTYPISLKFIAASGEKTVVATGNITITQGPTW